MYRKPTEQEIVSRTVGLDLQWYDNIPAAFGMEIDLFKIRGIIFSEMHIRDGNQSVRNNNIFPRKQCYGQQNRRFSFTILNHFFPGWKQTIYKIYSPVISTYKYRTFFQMPFKYKISCNMSFPTADKFTTFIIQICLFKVFVYQMIVCPKCICNS